MIEKLKIASDYKSNILDENEELLEDMRGLIKENIGQKEEIKKLKRKLQR